MSLLGACGGITEIACTETSIQDEGVDKGQASTINFVGSGVIASVSNDIATITVSGGGGSGMAIGGAVTSGTSGSILFVDSSVNLAQDNANLFWDDTNNRLGIGTITPAQSLEIKSGKAKIISGSDYVMINPSNASGQPEIEFFNAGIGQGFLYCDTDSTFAAPAIITSIGFLVNGKFRNTSSFLTGGTLASVASGYTPVNSNAGIAELVSATGNPSFINFTEKAIAFRGTFGYAGGSGDLIYYSDGSGTYASGTERFRVTGANFGIGTGGAAGALLDLGKAGTTLGVMRMAGSTTGNVTVQPAAAAGTWTMTLPITAGSNGQVHQTDGTGATTWVTAPYVLSTTTGIDAKTVATTTLYTVPTGKTAIITAAIIRCTTASSISVAPNMGIGRNATQDDIFASVALTGLTATTSIFAFSSIGTLATGAATELIKLGIDTGATATTMTIAVDLIGYLV